jgi:hypothetical protein
MGREDDEKAEGQRADPQQQSKERGFEVGKDEAWFSNIKRTYDEYQDLAIGIARFVNAQMLKQMSDAQNLTNQMMQNAIESANMTAKNALVNIDTTAKQTIRHADIAIDRQWNLDEVSRLASNPTVEAVGAALAASIAKTLADMLGGSTAPTE